MTVAIRPLLIISAIAVINAGCGGANRNGLVTTTSTTVTPTSERTSAVTLRANVRSAIAANLQLSLYVLWHNRVPVWAMQSTRGPALIALRSAAATRRRQGIQIKNLSGHQTVVSISLAPSYTTATAVIRDQRRVAPYKSGHRLGRAISGNEHSRIELHRVDNTARFVVWRVSPIQ